MAAEACRVTLRGGAPGIDSGRAEGSFRGVVGGGVPVQEELNRVGSAWLGGRRRSQGSTFRR
jgi:hypothetical protein